MVDQWAVLRVHQMADQKADPRADPRADQKVP
jgi:hypothetical protein